MTDIEYRNAWSLAYHKGGEETASAVTLEWLLEQRTPCGIAEMTEYYGNLAQSYVDEMIFGKRGRDTHD